MKAVRLLVRWRATSIVVLLAVTALAAPAAVAEEISGRVIGIADGDTITVLTNNHKRIRVRLAEIDAPEKGQPWGQRAKGVLSALVYGQTVKVQNRGTDQYGRVLGRVYAGGRNINAELVRSGAAWAYRDYLTDYSLVSLETQARKQHQGLWSLAGSQTVPPWEWRHGQRATGAMSSASPSTGYQCGVKRYCRQMTSCDEARYYLNSCGVSSLDGDSDGTPCETLCR